MDRRTFIQTGICTFAEAMALPSPTKAIVKEPVARNEVHVAIQGDDSNPGTEQEPFASLDRARKEIRDIRKLSRGPITAWVHKGTYYFDGPLTFRPEDSGTFDSPIVYAAWPGELVTLSGGRKLNSIWKPYKGRISRCFVDTGQPGFTQLFINGKRQHRARYPHYDAANPLVDGKGYIDVGDASETWPNTRFHFDPALFTKKRWSKPQDAVVHLFPRDYWGNLQWEVTGIDWDQYAIELGWGGFQLNEQLFGKAATGIGRSELYHGHYKSRFFVENVFEELETPGEWYLDRVNGLLYAMPEDGVDLPQATVETPELEQVVEFRGSQREPVRFITLSGFRIAHTTSTFLASYEAPSLGDWTIHRGGAVFLEGAEDCTIEDCFFDAVGGNGVFLNDYNRKVRIYGNRFTEAGDSAICLVGSDRKLQGSSRPIPAENVISNNLIHDCGVFGKQTAGVFVSIGEQNVISHNHIYNMPRAAICLNDGWGGGHVIEFNSIHDTVRETHDHGPINSWGRGRYWCMVQSHGNASHGSGFHEGDQDYPFAYPEADGATTIIRNNFFREPLSVHQLGIDLDDGSSHFHICDNLCIGIGIKLREGDYRIVENNIFYHPANPPAFHQGYEGNRDRFIRNIVVTTAATSNAFGKSSVPGDSYQIAAPPQNGPFAAEIDQNIFFNDMGEFLASLTPRGQNRIHYTFQAWKDLGYDKHSLYVDPEFVDPPRGDFNLRDNSPALRMGFRNVDLSKVGLLPDFPKQWLDGS